MSPDPAAATRSTGATDPAADTRTPRPAEPAAPSAAIRTPGPADPVAAARASGGLTLDAYVRLVADETGMPLGPAQVTADFDELPDWDSLHLLKLVTALERALGRKVPVSRLLEARSLQGIYETAVLGW
ncbi:MULTISPECIES: acyl carrier protein [unclassified Streptomyces]|uniref:acyl carrier protein n=1 Tax=unclassified Streptomyces TaxID=2593676 RepID=UPI000D1A4F13|nr:MULTISPECIES: acyl carrier protein [unclassified Streptomyces]